MGPVDEREQQAEQHMEANLQPRGPNRETMRHHYRQLLRKSRADDQEIRRLREELTEQRLFRAGLGELQEICQDKETPSQTRLITIASAIEEVLKTE